MHAVIRRWNAASSLIDVMASRTDEVEKVLSGSPGFVAYHAVRSGNTLVTITVCQDKAGTDESSRRAKQWLRDTLPADQVDGLVPEMIDGEDFIHFSAPQRLGTSSARA